MIQAIDCIMITSECMSFGWEEEKARINLARRNVSFDKATSVFDDPLFLTFADPALSSRATVYYRG
jgi:uncharacterized DUF497 family protein